MYKLIDSASFYPEGEPMVTVLDTNSVHGLLKQAAASEIVNYVSSIKPDPIKGYVHIIAMGASGDATSGGAWPSNRNGDIFPAQNLRDCHKTFEETGFIYRNHQNKNPATSIGKVVFSFFSESMQRVELIAWIDKIKGADIFERIEAGDYPSTSMACRTPADTCSICGNVSKTRDEYCEHLRNQLGKVYPDGRRVGAVNNFPLRFVDQSIVFKPADITSSILVKVASHGDQEHTKSSAELAEEAGLIEKSASTLLDKSAEMKKLSEFIKEIDGDIVNADMNMEKLLAKTSDPDTKLIPILKNFKLNEVGLALATLGISPSLAFLSELIAIRLHGAHMEGSGKFIANLVKDLDLSKIVLPKDDFEPVTTPVESLLRLLSHSAPSSSLHPEYVEKRSYDTTYSDFHGIHPGTNIGYIGNGPHIEPTPFEKWRAANPTQESSGTVKLLKTLISIGGAALAMKWMITRIMEKNMQENAIHAGPGVKIVLVKSASDLKLTYKLARADMIRSLKH